MKTITRKNYWNYGYIRHVLDWQKKLPQRWRFFFNIMKRKEIENSFWIGYSSNEDNVYGIASSRWNSRRLGRTRKSRTIEINIGFDVLVLHNARVRRPINLHLFVNEDVDRKYGRPWWTAGWIINAFLLTIVLAIFRFCRTSPRPCYSRTSCYTMTCLSTFKLSCRARLPTKRLFSRFYKCWLRGVF